MNALFRLRDWQVGTRLAFGFGLILTLMCVIALLGLGSIERSRALHDVYEQALRAQEQGNQVDTLLRQDLVKSQAIIRSAGMPEVTDRFKPELVQGDAQITQLLNALTQHESASVRDGATQLKSRHQAYVQIRNTVLDLVETGQTMQASEREQAALVPAARTVGELSTALRKQVSQRTDSAQTDFSQLTATAKWLIAGLTLATMLGGTIWAWFIGRSVSRPALIALQASEAMADGQLTHSVEVLHSQDEMGRMLQSMQRMRQALITLTTEVRDQSEQLARTAHDVASGADHVAQSARQHADDLADSRGVLQRIEADITHNLQRTTRASSLASTAQQVAQEGQASMSRVVTTMQGIREASRRVADIISVIDGIAFQTNILALNAAVEAARAGEQGRGFAVVAAEVRSLAQRSATAAREIKQLITDSVARVSEGTELVGHTGSTIEQLQNTIVEVASLIQHLSASSGQHADSISAVRQTVEKLDEATHHNLAMMSQSTAAAAGLGQQADHLLQSVSVFRLSPH
ncbi:MAG TPA: methyl-accepting chemotaxis protein [Aquabacterium sp.]|nr:methyl-accepting chemotaxis protein [Aquabacterium sp.]